MPCWKYREQGVQRNSDEIQLIVYALGVQLHKAGLVLVGAVGRRRLQNPYAELQEALP